MNYHALVRKQAKMENVVGPTLTYLAKNEAVLHNNMLVYYNPCRFTMKTVIHEN